MSSLLGQTVESEDDSKRDHQANGGKDCDDSFLNANALNTSPGTGSVGDYECIESFFSGHLVYPVAVAQNIEAASATEKHKLAK